MELEKEKCFIHLYTIRKTEKIHKNCAGFGNNRIGSFEEIIKI